MNEFNNEQIDLRMDWLTNWRNRILSESDQLDKCESNPKEKIEFKRYIHLNIGTPTPGQPLAYFLISLNYTPGSWGPPPYLYVRS